MTLRITFTDKQIYERIFKIPQPDNNVDLSFRMLHTYLENFKWNIDRCGRAELTADQACRGNNSDYLKLHYAIRISYQNVAV